MTIQEKTIDSIRILAAEAVTNAKSGHTGICMDAAPIGYALYGSVMNHNPLEPSWINRDRFVLSAGHGSVLLYALLHVFGYNVTADDLKNFRKFESKTPGHPEYGVTSGVDCSTGPLGQGIANAVGFALAESMLAETFNKEGYDIINHYTYALCGEGCLEEGISYEACSFAGTNKLGKLILFYDCNKISIEGNTDVAFSEDVSLRFKAQHWQVLEVNDANNIEELLNAVWQAKQNKEQPSIIICRSQIGYGTPIAGTAAVHGTPLNSEQLQQTKDFFDWREEPFAVSSDVKSHAASCVKERSKAYAVWQKQIKEYKSKFPELAEKFDEYFQKDGYDLADLYNALKTDNPEATRISGGIVINALAKIVPNLISGSADLAPSTKTDIQGGGWYSPTNRTGRNIHFGIREHAMAAICNGIALHGGLKVICSTFFVFSDYMKGAMRMSAIMNLPVLYVLTHDSIGVGEDGPTHEPIEQLAMLRAMPNINVFRPSDRMETIKAFEHALNISSPSVLVMSRQNLNQKNGAPINGGYIVSDCNGKPDAVILSSGSEVDICMAAQALLLQNNIRCRVVAMYCAELFDLQSDEYKNSIISHDSPIICVEASSDNIWYKYAKNGAVMNMQEFGASGDMKLLYGRFGFTPDNVAKQIKKTLKIKE